MKVPVLLFDNIMLRDIDIKDAKDMFEYGSDPEVCKTLNWGPYTEINEAKYAINSVFGKRPKDGLPKGYAIIDLTNHKMIGTVDFHTIHADGSVEIGYALNRQYWQQGIMSKCVKKLLEVGFNVLKYDTIVVDHLPSNEASKKVILKAGFKPDGIKKNAYLDRHTGERLDLIAYKLTKEDYYGTK